MFGNVGMTSEAGVIRKNGIGLGLTICKQLINLLGGTVTFSSEL